MENWILFNARLGTIKWLTEKEMQEAKKFYNIDFPTWDEYYQKYDENSLRNARGDMFLSKQDRKVTLELKRYNEVQYSLYGVGEITNDTEYGEGYFAIFIFDRRVFYIDDFEFVRCEENGEYYIKDGKWVYKSELKKEESENK